MSRVRAAMTSELVALAVLALDPGPAANPPVAIPSRGPRHAHRADPVAQLD